MQSCMEMLKKKWGENKFVCVGFDPQWDKMPKHLTVNNIGRGPRMKDFITSIIYETRDVACAYKANLWFYLAEGLQGLWALEESINFAKGTAPNVPVGLDMKAGDIGSTMEQAAKFAFDILGADFITVNPWGGKEDGLDAVLKYKDKGIFVWCRGSNEGTKEFQEMKVQTISMGALLEECVYEVISERVSGFNEYYGCVPENGWNFNRNCGVVVGASKGRAEPIKRVRRLVADMPILIPGIGVQEGDLEASVKAALYTDRTGGVRTFPAFINSSRSIIYASSGKDFAETARSETIELNNKILEILKNEGVI